MSWAEEDWTVGLSGRVLHKVKELQVQQDRLSRENKQKQLQLDNSQDALYKQKVKHDEVRQELQTIQRELKGVQEEARVKTSAAERLSLELQTKQSQVCSLEGQLDAARTLTQNLTLEVKRLEVELEKLQTSSRDASLFSTPCWNTTSPSDHNTGKQEDRSGQRGDEDSRALHQQLQFSDTPTGSLPRHSRGTPHQRHPSDQSETFSTPMAAFPWERDDSRPATRGRCRPPTPQMPSDPPSHSQLEQRDRGRTENLSKETDACVSELHSRVCALEAELRAEADRLKASQEQLGRSQKELAAVETNLQKSRDQISLAQTRTVQESDRASGAEQKAKKLQEELKCQRENAESSRLQHQQRTKELEKQHQMDVSELHKDRRSLELQHQQEVTKLSQELQQATVLHNTLQTQAEKLSLQKQALDREVETLKAKLKWTEGQLQESQKKDAQTQAKLTEALREAQGVAVSLEQSTRREKSLEEQGRKVMQERDDALHLIKELREQNAALALPVAPLQHCSMGQSFSLEPRPTGPSKKSPGERRCEPGREQGRGRQAAPKYPTDREPGEGIDAEHIRAMGPSMDSESPQRSGQPEDDRMTVSNSSGTQKIPVANQPDASLSLQSEAAVEARILPREQEADMVALRKENVVLSSELQDVREELQRRLEDLEAQRRAEAEARTRLKQLSKKRAGREAEVEEQERGRKAELERERTETERLRKALASLQAQVSREEKEAEAQGEQGREDREQELMELNIQMKAQLSEARAQLALEREERQREEEERKKGDVAVGEKAELSIRLAELEAELEALKRHGKKDLPLPPEAKSPLTYLTLHNDDDDDKLNANITALCPGLDENRTLLPSPDRNRLLCRTANQLNTAVSQTTAELILTEDQGAELLKLPLLSSDGPTPMEGTSPDSLEDSTPEELTRTPACPESPAPADLAMEVERLREENTREAWRAEQCQAKLEALQSQVTRQTQQLTMAFELQSQHITGLLAELQEKESALLSQGGQLQCCRQALAQLMANAAPREDAMAPVTADPGPGADGRSELHAAASPSESCSRDTVSHTASGDQRLDNEAEAPSSRALQDVHGRTVDALLAYSEQGSEDGVVAQVPSPRPETLPASGGSVEEEEDPAASDTRGQDSDPSATTGPCTAGCWSPEEERQCSGGVTLGGSSKGPQQVEVSREVGVNREDNRKDEKEQDSLGQVSHLEQQVVALQAELRALSEEREKQAEELVLWRLASLPTPASGLQQHSLDLKDQTQPLNGSLRLPESPQAPRGAVEVDASTLGTEEPEVTQDMFQDRSTLTLIREDELFLSCASRKLQGCMLTCRLQRSDLTEPKSVSDVEKTHVSQDTDDLIDDEVILPLLVTLETSS
ncbi:Centromere protein F [Merluccius polli]|uniref:Centromere protein F n=1 Tax=Merluccius polli TaxID=89951 RepID=A0AA47NMN8_MERPO|nr:Centromere protein F [Merluccius polli]